MSIVMEEEIKRWTARRKSALVLDLIRGKTTVSEASRQDRRVGFSPPLFVLTPSRPDARRWWAKVHPT